MNTMLISAIVSAIISIIVYLTQDIVKSIYTWSRLKFKPSVANGKIFTLPVKNRSLFTIENAKAFISLDLNQDDLIEGNSYTDSLVFVNKNLFRNIEDEQLIWSNRTSDGLNAIETDIYPGETKKIDLVYLLKEKFKIPSEEG